MKFWTIQDRNILKIIENNRIYQPNFNKSRFLEKNKELTELYNFLLKSYNDLNSMSLPGLIYAFMKHDGKKTCEINDKKEFDHLIKTKKNIVGGYWSSIDIENSIVLELNYNENFQFIPIDLNDFQFLMPPKVPLFWAPQYTTDSERRIHSNIEQGIEPNKFDFPTGIMQVHLPNIKKENILNTYSCFKLE
ncbi:hypothetical protein [Helicobacter pylori]|uniref:hypothetical protein n=5 Tax=Helicobacter pylori TaxID=210 RepID=UPI000BE8C6C9|nr:hypothetical protein [Helicobacter pylori]KAA6512888.1 hypothetical protein EPC80_05575 [Helicobacter pylori]KAA8892091.1 hypothetical protein EPC82_04645 [Helicobacter pylori]MCQ2938793.1 hypothetical protein [Helicobacter pylori]NHA47557.1 hypothetical protein [Helicobacter pylori]NHA56694.1 hypothetical protein [Helicobacter pylori]